MLEILKAEYYAALSISEENDFQLHLKRPPNSCFVNNYFSKRLRSWEANLDIQKFSKYYDHDHDCRSLRKYSIDILSDDIFSDITFLNGVTLCLTES